MGPDGNAAAVGGRDRDGIAALGHEQEEPVAGEFAEPGRAALENLAVTTATMDFLVPHTDEQRLSL
ncbi:hypothetical protein ACSNOI_35400, partial [Actinomadura kijaniata]|uniref:hypothetical protein n=1 Tax=Actinomadura kijaniata TaxID=46161 RepID=UPI003F1D4662